MIKKYRLMFLAICAGLFLAACGYHFSGEGEGPKPGLKYIAVPVFENRTSEPNLGAMIAGAIRQQFLRKGPMKVVPVEDAEAVFKGTVVSIFSSPVAHHPSQSIASSQVTIEDRVYVTVDIRCEDKKTGKVIWRGPIQYYKVYQVGDDPLHPDPLGGFKSRSAILEVIASEIAVRVHDRFLSNF